MKIVADGFEFFFEGAKDVFIFDEKDPKKSTFHGAPMKGVDIVAVFPDQYIFIEIKDYTAEADQYDEAKAADTAELMAVCDKRKWLKNYLKYKFRDTYLYRHAEDKVDKEIHYLCLLTFDNALCSTMAKSLRKELPVGRNRRWVRELAKSCNVLNVVQWNKNFPKWQVAVV